MPLRCGDKIKDPSFEKEMQLLWKTLGPDKLSEGFSFTFRLAQQRIAGKY